MEVILGLSCGKLTSGSAQLTSGSAWGRVTFPFLLVMAERVSRSVGTLPRTSLVRSRSLGRDDYQAAFVSQKVIDDLRKKVASLEAIVSILQEDRTSLQNQLSSSDCPNSLQQGQEEGWRVAGRTDRSVTLARSTPSGNFCSDADKRKTYATALTSAPAVPTRNSFQALASLEEEGQREDAEDTSERQRDGKAVKHTLPKGKPGCRRGKILVVGDSLVRYQDRTFCARDSERRMRVCYPGARIGDVLNMMDNVLANNGRQPIVCLAVGSNDIGSTRSPEMLQQYKAALTRIRERGAVPVLCGILPRLRGGQGWPYQAQSVNNDMAAYCREKGISFLNLWDAFEGRPEMFARDGVHLSRRGTELVAAGLEGAVSGLGAFLEG